MSASSAKEERFAELSLPQAPVVRVVPPGPESRKYLELQARHESSAVSYSRGMPMAIRRARGATIEDVDGNVFIDLFGGAGVMAVGHAHPAAVEAARRQLELATHTLDIPTPARAGLVQVLLRFLPKELSRLFFGGPTGSDAVEQAIKLAKHNTGRHSFIAFSGSYHGMTAGALALTSAEPHKEGLRPLMPEVHFAPYAYCYRCPFGREEAGCGLECARYLEHLLDDPHSGVGKPAAVIIEPIQGEGGSVVPPDRFLPEVRRICDKHGVLLICDEIQCGLGRTGRMFAFEHTGVVPDIVTMSKALGGIGLPISGIAYREKLNTWPAGKTIGTFRGNLLAYAAGAAALSWMLETDLAGYALAAGEKALASLKALEKDSPIIGEARGRGLMFGVEFVKDKASREPAPELARQVRTGCHQRGVMIEIGGHYGNVARFLPPLVITESCCARGWRSSPRPCARRRSRAERYPPRARLTAAGPRAYLIRREDGASLAGKLQGEDTRLSRVRVSAREQPAPGAFLLRFERKLEFLPGQNVNVTVDPLLPPRAYSIASGVGDPFTEILFTVIEGGRLTPRLARLGPGDSVWMSGPFGSFRDGGGPSWWIAGGTGVAPFRAMVLSGDRRPACRAGGCWCRAAGCWSGCTSAACSASGWGRGTGRAAPGPGRRQRRPPRKGCTPGG